MDEITPRSKKEDIFSAYQELLKKYDSIKDSDKKEKEVKQVEKKEIVKKASSYQSDDIIQRLGEVRGSITRMLGEIGEKMVEKEKELKQLEEAIEIEQKRLEDIHQIHAEADTLAELLKLHQDEREKYKDEIAALKLEYETKKKEFTEEFEEEKEKLERQRKQEEDEYNYNLNIKHRKAQDALNEDLEKKRRKFEEDTNSRLKEIDEREKIIMEKEDEFNKAKARVAILEKEMVEKVKAAEERIREELGREFKHEREIQEKTFEGEKKLDDLRIENLNATLEKLQQENTKLKEELRGSTKQIQDIALRTIEGYSGKKALEAVNTIALEQARGSRRDKDEGK